MNYIPPELVNYIINYSFGKCYKCNKIYNYKNLKSNFKLKKYRTVFDDDYDLEPFIIYYRICDNCILTS